MVCICRSVQTPCTRICQIFATIYDSIVYAGENRIKEYLFFPYHSPRCGVNLFRIRYCSQELVCEAIVVPRTLSNYVEAILWGATETKKSLRVNLCRKLLRHSTRKDSVSDRKANTNRFTTFGGCHRNREGECFLAPQGFCPE